MLPVASLASIVLLATCIAATPADPVAIRGSPTIITLPISRKLNVNANGTLDVVQRDKARQMSIAIQFDSSISSSAPSAALIDNVFVYLANVGIGNPSSFYNLLVDTSSANTWVGANQPYIPTKTSMKTNDSVKVTYNSGSFEGTQCLDVLTVATNAVISPQSIGVATHSSGFKPYDGVLGIGPKGLTRGTLSPNRTAVIPTVTDNLFNQNVIGNNSVSIYLQPTTTGTQLNGEMTFGGIDATKITEYPTAFPLTKNSPASNFWGVDANFRYGDSATLMASTGSGIIDSGTALIYLSLDAYNAYSNKTSATLDTATGFLYISPQQYPNLQSLFFDIGGSSFELSPNAQIWPRSQNGAIGGTDDRLYLVVQSIGESFPGMDFICGAVFMERFYTVFDTGNRQIGLAYTPNTFATTN